MPSPREPLPEAFLNLHVNLHVKKKVHPIGARCSDDLAAAHYRLAHAVPMVGHWPPTEPKFSIGITTN